jgi:hypothetical protein
MKPGLPNVPEPLKQHKLGGGIHVSGPPIEEPFVRRPRYDAEERKGLSITVQVGVPPIRRQGNEPAQDKQLIKGESILVHSRLIRPGVQKPYFAHNLANRSSIGLKQRIGLMPNEGQQRCHRHAIGVDAVNTAKNEARLM